MKVIKIIVMGTASIAVWVTITALVRQGAPPQLYGLAGALCAIFGVWAAG